MTQSTSASAPRASIGFKELVALVAMLMALNALAIDSMLPALPAIGAGLGIDDANQRQWVVTAYLLGFGVTQIIYGPLSDRFGRRPVLFVGVVIYVAFSLLAAFAWSFEALLAARVLQGVGAASTRVLAVAIVRDQYEGRRMAQVMSLSFLVFLGVPIIAPSLGALILMLGPWRWIFAVLGLWGVAILIRAGLRLPETLHPENRMPIDLKRITSAAGETVSNRLSIGYTLAMAVIVGCLFGFINSSQQVFEVALGNAEIFPIIFAVVGCGIAAASLLNAGLVQRLGQRLLSHTALIGFTVFSAIHFAAALAGWESLTAFAVLQTLTMFCFGFIGGNFGSMAMTPLGHIAGTAAAVQGVISSVGGALIGFFIGQQFDGTTVPLTAGFTLCGLTAIAIVLWTERGRLFSAVEEAAAN
ncbi:MAG: multidrug effflux MFS transporter [Caulobacterales bacterium]|nr:multidrug effflux MFS transporter [Caulobacterales bacterium]